MLRVDIRKVRMPKLTPTLDLNRCPHCSIARPHLPAQGSFVTQNAAGKNERTWLIYKCTSCGGLVTAWAEVPQGEVCNFYPESPSAAPELPERPRIFLAQAQESLHAPAGAVMLAASSVDAMLKERGLTQGSLYARIEQAVSQHMITTEMGHWAHAVRLDANDQRHADQASTLPTESDAQRCIDFVVALGEILFVLPSRITRGLGSANSPT